LTDDVVGDPVAEIFLFGVTAHVDEREDANRCFVLPRYRFRRWLRRRRRSRRGLADRRDQFAQQVRIAMTVPVAKADRMELAKA
jgi:hypothetical protein